MIKKSYLEVYKEGDESHLWVPNLVFVSFDYKSPLTILQFVRKANRSKGQAVQPLEDPIKSGESIHDSCGPGCRFFLATSKMISRVVKMENE